MVPFVVRSEILCSPTADNTQTRQPWEKQHAYRPCAIGIRWRGPDKALRQSISICRNRAICRLRELVLPVRNSTKLQPLPLCLPRPQCTIITVQSWTHSLSCLSRNMFFSVFSIFYFGSNFLENVSVIAVQPSPDFCKHGCCNSTLG